MIIVIFRQYSHRPGAPDSGSTRWSHCGSFRVLSYDNVNHNEDRIWITLIDSIQSHGGMNCQILKSYEVWSYRTLGYFFCCTLHLH